MKKFLLLATAAMLVSGVSFADCGKGKGKKCKKSSGCCKKSGKKCGKTDKTDKEKEATVKL